MKRVRRKPPTMPRWFWYSVMDGCWNCKDRNGCHNCRLVMQYRKESFPGKVKGSHTEPTLEWEARYDAGGGEGQEEGDGL